MYNRISFDNGGVYEGERKSWISKKYQLETIPKELKKVAKTLGVTDDNIRVPLNVGVYI